MADSFSLFRNYMTTTTTETVVSSGASGLFSTRMFNGISSTINVTAISGINTAITFILEESDDGIIWSAAYPSLKFTSTSNQKIPVARLSSQYFRFSWTVIGTTPSVTFEIQSTLKSQVLADPPNYRIQSDTFNSTGTGSVVNSIDKPLTNFTLTVTATGIVTSWVIELEGSTNGIDFSTITKHTELIGNGVSIFSGTNVSPCLYFRARCLSINLGLGTSITATILGVR